MSERMRTTTTGRARRGARPLMIAFVAAALLAVATPAPAAAACKRGLTNQLNDVFGWAKVVTQWCYSGGTVTSRHSQKHAQVSVLGYARGYLSVTTRCTYTKCHNYNGYTNHNCLTHAQVHAAKADYSQGWWCIQTRIYGNGAHRRAITPGLCA